LEVERQLIGVIEPAGVSDGDAVIVDADRPCRA
jgi:hypothetical protein